MGGLLVLHKPLSFSYPIDEFPDVQIARIVLLLQFFEIPADKEIADETDLHAAQVPRLNCTRILLLVGNEPLNQSFLIFSMIIDSKSHLTLLYVVASLHFHFQPMSVPLPNQLPLHPWQTILKLSNNSCLLLWQK